MRLHRKEYEIVDLILLFCSIAGIFAWPVKSAGVYDKKKGHHLKKRNDLHINGVSDIGAVYKGDPIACEVKTPVGVLSKEQRHFLVKHNEAGGIAFVARSLWQFVDELSKHYPEDAPRFQAIAAQLELKPNGRH